MKKFMRRGCWLLALLCLLLTGCGGKGGTPKQTDETSGQAEKPPVLWKTQGFAISPGRGGKARAEYQRISASGAKGGFDAAALCRSFPRSWKSW